MKTGSIGTTTFPQWDMSALCTQAQETQRFFFSSFTLQDCVISAAAKQFNH